MSAAHCPACAAFARWAPVWEARRLEGKDASTFKEEGAALDLAEYTAWNHAQTCFFWIGRSATPESIERSRPFVCDDARTQRRPTP